MELIWAHIGVGLLKSTERSNSLIILYGFMFLVIQGYVIIDSYGVHWHSNVRAHLDLSGGDTEEDRENKAITKIMLLSVFFTLLIEHL